MIPAGQDGAPFVIPGDTTGGLLLVADHASNHVPADIDLGIDPALLDQHVAIDIGVAPLAHALCRALDCPGLLARVSRLVLDTNRAPGSPGLIPAVTDGHPVPGNAALDDAGRRARMARFWQPWHDGVAAHIDRHRPRLILSLHSFTPRLATSDEDRPWHVGILYNRDDRAAALAIPALRAAGIPTGDNQPYSGRVLNFTMDAHAEANGVAYLGVEVRQDLIADTAGVERMSKIITQAVGHVKLNLREGAVAR